MRTVSAVTIALLALAPLAAQAAASDPYAGVQAMRVAFARVQSVQLVERFPNGAVATVQLTPAEPARVSLSSVSKDRLLLEYATQPAGDPAMDLHQQFTITSLGRKSLYGTSVDGYRLLDQTGAVETLWVNEHNLPVAMHIEAYGESVDVLYGDYDNPALFATKQ